MTIVDRSSRAGCCYSKMHELTKLRFPGDCACEEALHKRDANNCVRRTKKRASQAAFDSFTDTPLH